MGKFQITPPIYNFNYDNITYFNKKISIFIVFYGEACPSPQQHIEDHHQQKTGGETDCAHV